MTTTPTPEQTLAEYKRWRASNGSIGFPDANRLATACEALIGERDHARTLVKNLQDMVSDRNHFIADLKAERDQALARLAAMEPMWLGNVERAEKAEARVAVLREAIRKYGWNLSNGDNSKACLQPLVDALATGDKAVEALLAELDTLKARITALEADLAHADGVIKDLAKERDEAKLPSPPRTLQSPEAP